MPSNHPGNVAANTRVVSDITDDEAISQQTLAEQSLKAGDQWIFREVFELGDSASEEFVIDNPTSNTDLRVVGRSIQPDLGISGNVWANSEITSLGTDFRVLNARIEDPELSDSGFDVAYGGDYEDRSESEGLPIRTPRSEDEPGVTVSIVRTGSTAVFRVAPGANVHYEITNDETSTNNVLVQFILSERPEIDVELNG